MSAAATPAMARAPSGAQNRVRLAVAAFRLRHPELRDGVTVLSLLAACHRDGVRVRRRRLSADTYGLALALPWDTMRAEIGPPSAYLRVIHLSPRLVGTSLTYVFAHEIAHHELGHCIDGVSRALRGRARKGWEPETAADRRRTRQHESEANAFAQLLTGLEVPSNDSLELAA